jgi:hypothetical protein
MPIRLLTDAKHWRDRAGEVRATAERMTVPEAKRMMLAIAISYDRLAKRAEEYNGLLVQGGANHL